MVDVVVRLEQHVATVGVDRDAAVGRDPLPGLVRIITRDGKPRSASDDGHRTAQDDARGGGVGLAQDGDRLGAHRAGVIKAVQRVGCSRDVDPPRVGRQHGGGVADETRTGVAQTPDRDVARRRGHGGAGVDAVVAGAGDATQDDALATGQGIVQGDAIGRSGQGAPIGRGDVTAGRRAGDAGRATPGVVERDDAGDGDRARIEVSARSIDVVVDTGRGAGGDRQVARHEARGLVARREVIGDEAVAAARVLGQRDRAVLADVVVRFEQDAAAVRVIRDRASLIDAAGELVAVIPSDEQVAAAGHDGQRAEIDRTAGREVAGSVVRPRDGDVLGRDETRGLRPPGVSRAGRVARDDDIAGIRRDRTREINGRTAARLAGHEHITRRRDERAGTRITDAGARDAADRDVARGRGQRGCGVDGVRSAGNTFDDDPIGAGHRVIDGNTFGGDRGGDVRRRDETADRRTANPSRTAVGIV